MRLRKTPAALAACGAASSILFTIPVMIFFLLVQRRMTTGLVAGAVKG